MRIFTLLLSAVLASAVFSGCQRKISETNLQAVKPDMTFKEVESILGAPNRIETAPELVSHEVKTLPVTRYVYEQKGEKVELTFVGDRLGSGSSVSNSSVSGSNTTVTKWHVKKNDIPAITGTFSK